MITRLQVRAGSMRDILLQGCLPGVGLQGIYVRDADLPVSFNIHEGPHYNGASRLEVVRSICPA